MNIQKSPFLAHSYELEKDYRIVAYSDVSNEKIYRHSHNFYEMYMLISGRIVYNTAGTSFYLKPGDFLFINRNQEHFPEILDLTIPYERLALQVLPKTLEDLSLEGVDLSECFTRNNFLVYHYPAAIHSKLEGLIEQLHQLYNNKSSYGNKILGRSFLAQFFVEVNAHNNDPNIFSFSRSNKDLGLIALVDHYVKNHLDSQITIADLSEYFYLNRYYFMHLFKEATGITIYQYILKLRLDAAEEMIKSGMSLTNASQRCGFCDYSNYYRCFKKEYGKSPKEYYNSPELSSIIGKTSGK